MPAFTEYKDAKGEDKDFFKILDKYERNDKFNAFAEKHGISARELLSQLENPPATSPTKRPTAEELKAREDAQAEQEAAKRNGIGSPTEANPATPQTPFSTNFKPANPLPAVGNSK